MTFRIKALLMLAAFYMSVAMAEDILSKAELASIFKTYDVPEDDEPDCAAEYIDDIICPKDETIPCADMSVIQDYCIELLGKDIATPMLDLETNNGLNAIQGCVKYVGFHVVEADHLACCQSDVCEAWLEETFENMDGYYDDDDDYYDEDEF
jgi:hypothetical protein